MPVLHEVPALAEADPDQSPRGVVAFGITAPTIELAQHRHRKAQLLFTRRGVLTCEVESGLWLVPPQRAIWIPSGMTHAIRSSGPIEGYNAFVDPPLVTGMPSRCCTISVTPLLRELLIRAAGLSLDYAEKGADAHLVALLLAEIAAAPIERLHLPMPENARLRQIVEGMMADPSRRGTVRSWASHAGLGERTLARLLARETGMSFGRWRQQLAIMIALRRIAEGASIQRTAADLGYESAGSFVTMFRKAMGVSPVRYMRNVNHQHRCEPRKVPDFQPPNS